MQQRTCRAVILAAAVHKLTSNVKLFFRVPPPAKSSLRVQQVKLPGVTHLCMGTCAGRDRALHVSSLWGDTERERCWTGRCCSGTANVLPRSLSLELRSAPAPAHRSSVDTQTRAKQAKYMFQDSHRYNIQPGGIQTLTHIQALVVSLGKGAPVVMSQYYSLPLQVPFTYRL